MFTSFIKNGSPINKKLILEALGDDNGSSSSSQKMLAIVDDEASGTLSFLASEGKFWQLLSTVMTVDKDRVSRYSDYDEMTDDPVIQSALELIVDDATQYSTEMNATIWPSNDYKYAEDIQNLFTAIDLENNAWGWVWNLAKNGDFFLGVNAIYGVGITGVDDSIHPKLISRIDINGKLAGFLHREGDQAVKANVCSPAKFVHFISNYRPNYESSTIKILRADYEKFLDMYDPSEWNDDLDPNLPVKKSTDRKNTPSQGNIDFTQQRDHSFNTRFKPFINESSMEDPDVIRSYQLNEGDKFTDSGLYILKKITSKYGTAVLQAARQIYKLLNLLEAMLAMARIARTPLIRVFYINTDGMTPKERREYVSQIKDEFKVKKAVDIPKNFYKEKYYPAGFNDDIFLPYAGTRGDVRADSIGGEINIKDIVDIEYLRDKLFAAIRIPKQFLGFECLRGNVRISLLDGSNPTILEMFDNKSNFIGRGVYSCTPEGKIEATTISHIVKTRKNASYVRVHLDNNEFFDVTPDHLCMTRDGTYLKAEELVPGTSLMPLYSFDSKGYKQFKDNSTDKWRPVHHMVAESFTPGLLVISNQTSKDSLCVHHLDSNKLNNDPSNLKVMTRHDHFKAHKNIIDLIFMKGRTVDVQRRRDHKLSKESRAKQSKTLRILRASGGLKKSKEGIESIKRSVRLQNRDYMRGDNNVMKNPIVYAHFCEKVKSVKRNYNSFFRSISKHELHELLNKARTQRVILNGIENFSFSCPYCSCEFKKRMTKKRHDSIIDSKKQLFCCGDHAIRFYSIKNLELINSPKNIQDFSFSCTYCGSGIVRRMSKSSYDSIDHTTKNYFCCQTHQRKFQANIMSLNKRISNLKLSGTYNHKVIKIEHLDITEDAYDLGVNSRNHNFSISSGVFIHNSMITGGTPENLTRLDIRYARGVKKVQRAFIEGIYRLVQIHLSFKYPDEDIDLSELRLSMVPVSSSEEDARLNAEGAKIATFSQILQVANDLQGIIDKKYLAHYLFQNYIDLPGIDLDKLFAPMNLPDKSLTPTPPFPPDTNPPDTNPPDTNPQDTSYSDLPDDSTEITDKLQNILSQLKNRKNFFSPKFNHSDSRSHGRPSQTGGPLSDATSIH